MVKDYKLKIVFYKELPSTQLFLKEQIQKSIINENIAIYAQRQTAGIGSRNNSWQTQEGNFYCSFAIQKKDLPCDLPLASASIYYSCILQQLLQKKGSKVWLKWPNDLYIQEKKIGGMITHMVGEFLVCGVGINLLSAPKESALLDIKISSKNLIELYMKDIEKKELWKQVFSKYKLEFARNKDFFAHHNGNKFSLRDAILEDDGSLSIDGERIYSLR